MDKPGDGYFAYVGYRWQKYFEEFTVKFVRKSFFETKGCNEYCWNHNLLAEIRKYEPNIYEGNRGELFTSSNDTSKWTINDWREKLLKLGFTLDNSEYVNFAKNHDPYCGWCKED